MPMLDLLGRDSFTIYFYHMYVIFFARWLLNFESPDISATWYLAVYCLAVGLPAALSCLGRLHLGSWSRPTLGS